MVRIREIRLPARLLQQTQEMLCVLIEILGPNAVASGSGFTRKRQVAVVALLRVGGSVVVATAPARSRIVCGSAVTDVTNVVAVCWRYDPHSSSNLYSSPSVSP